jgi:hypothetical protein
MIRILISDSYRDQETEPGLQTCFFFAISLSAFSYWLYLHGYSFQPIANSQSPTANSQSPQ